MRGKADSAFPRFRQSVLYPEDTARVLAAVRAAPGSVLRALALATDLHPNVVRGHAQVLSDQGRVELRRMGSRILVYPIEVAPGHGKRALVTAMELQLKEQQRLLAFIKQNPGLGQAGIAKATWAWKWARSTTQHRLGRLVQAGLVNVAIVNGKRRYSAWPSLSVSNSQSEEGPRQGQGATVGNAVSS